MMSVLNETMQLLPLRLWFVCKQYLDCHTGASAGQRQHHQCHGDQCAADGHSDQASP